MTGALAPAEASGTPASGDHAALVARIRAWGEELGFDQIGFAGIELSADEQRLRRWLALGRHGTMAYMAHHGDKRSRPAELVPGTRSVIVARMPYFPPATEAATAVLADPQRAYISRYALGRDYHKVLRRRLARLAARIAETIGPFGYRVFSDSAPVLEKALARDAGLGWIGKHTNLIDRYAGSWFFLGEIFTDLPLPPDPPTARDFCGSCVRCIAACPTGAIVAPHELDARRCISYLTIELHGPIPVALRPLLGNRIYGCDDCQLTCPWNRRARLSAEQDFRCRHGLDARSLVDLFAWTEVEFAHYTEASAIRRIGYTRWLRNIAVALGNAAPTAAIATALRRREEHPESCVREHVRWALDRHPIAIA